MNILSLKELCRNSVWAKLRSREPDWGGATEMLQLRSLPESEKMFISDCLTSFGLQSRRMKEAEIEKSIADGLLALPGVPQAVKEKYKQKSWIWIPDKEREVVGYDSNSFFSVFAYDEVGDFVVTDNIVPWDYLRRDSLLTEMRYVWEFSQEPITFVKEPKFS